MSAGRVGVLPEFGGVTEPVPRILCIRRRLSRCWITILAIKICLVDLHEEGVLEE